MERGGCEIEGGPGVGGIRSGQQETEVRSSGVSSATGRKEFGVADAARAAGWSGGAAESLGAAGRTDAFQAGRPGVAGRGTYGIAGCDGFENFRADRRGRTRAIERGTNGEAAV